MQAGDPCITQWGGVHCSGPRPNCKCSLQRLSAEPSRESTLYGIRFSSNCIQTCGWPASRAPTWHHHTAPTPSLTSQRGQVSVTIGSISPACNRHPAQLASHLLAVGAPCRGVPARQDRPALIEERRPSVLHLPAMCHLRPCSQQIRPSFLRCHAHAAHQAASFSNTEAHPGAEGWPHRQSVSLGSVSPKRRSSARGCVGPFSKSGCCHLHTSSGRGAQYDVMRIM